MRILASLFLLVSLASCTSNVRTPIVTMNLQLKSPFSQAKLVPVIYPYEGEEQAQGEDDSLERAFGPSWRYTGAEHPQYNFNP